MLSTLLVVGNTAACTALSTKNAHDCESPISLHGHKQTDYLKSNSWLAGWLVGWGFAVILLFT